MVERGRVKGKEGEGKGFIDITIYRVPNYVVTYKSFAAVVAVKIFSSRGEGNKILKLRMVT